MIYFVTVPNYNSKNVSFESVSEDFSQFIVETNNGDVNAFKRTIIHELYIEPLVLEALSLYYSKRLSVTVKNASKKKVWLRNKIYKTIKDVCEQMLLNQKESGEIQGAVRSRRPAKYEGYAMYACSDLICAFSSLISNNELLNNVVKVTLKQKLLVGVYIVLGLLIVIPVILSKEPLWLSCLLLIMNPIATNIMSNIIEKLLWVDE